MYRPPIDEEVLAILMRGENYGLAILRELEQGGRVVSLSKLYVTLARLERAGAITARWGDEVVKARGGARRRYYARVPSISCC